MNHIVITGVSSGIGHHVANHFLSNGWTVFGTVREERDAKVLENKFPGLFRPAILDITDHNAVDAFAIAVGKQLAGKTLDVLVNNAGIAVYGPLVHLPIDKFQHQIEVNVTAQLKMVQAFAGQLGGDATLTGRPGTIIQIGSVSGRFAMPILGPYCASKYAMEALSDCLRRELRPLGIHVALLQPAAVESGIWQKALAADFHISGTTYAVLEEMKINVIREIADRAMPTQSVTRVVWGIANRRSRKARYLISRNNLGTRLSWAIPDRMMDWLIMKRLKSLGLSYRTTS